MRVPPVQIFSSEDRWYDGLDHGVLVVEESKLVAAEEHPIHVLWGDEDEEGDDYVVDLIPPPSGRAGSPATRRRALLRTASSRRSSRSGALARQSTLIELTRRSREPPRPGRWAAQRRRARSQRSTPLK